MNILKSITIASNALKINRMRSVLTVLGVVIGISSVIVILSAGEAIKQYMIDEIESFGSDVIQVEIKVPAAEHQSADNAIGQAMGISITTLKHADALAIGKLSNIDKVYSGTLGQALAVRQNNNKNATLFGITYQFIDIDASEIKYGRFFTEEEDKSMAQVVVLGSDIKNTLFGESEAVGQTIRLGKYSYRVIGVLEERGSAMFFNWDDIIYLPLKTLQKRVMGIDHITYLVGVMRDSSKSDATKAEIESLLRDRHNISNPKRDDFAVTTMDEMMAMLGAIMGGVQILLIAIASMSLIVGGVGIMNIMYVSVSERTFEIGLCKSIGATSKNILWQFLWEAIFITLMGAIIGVVIGVVMSWALATLAQNQGYNFQFILPWWSVVVAAGFAVFIGLIFGIYPAKTAASLEPIEALRK